MKVKKIHQADSDEGLGAVYLPDATVRKNAAVAREWGNMSFPAAGCLLIREAE